jgi:hypothetical protein
VLHNDDPYAGHVDVLRPNQVLDSAYDSLHIHAHNLPDFVTDPARKSSKIFLIRFR